MIRQPPIHESPLVRWAVGEGLPVASPVSKEAMQESYLFLWDETVSCLLFDAFSDELMASLSQFERGFAHEAGHFIVARETGNLGRTNWGCDVHEEIEKGVDAKQANYDAQRFEKAAVEEERKVLKRFGIKGCWL